METIHFHYIYELMEEQVWRGWRNLYSHYLDSLGLNYYWELRHNLLSDRFQEFVASLEKRGTVSENTKGGACRFSGTE
jgi:hypothetical protein